MSEVREAFVTSVTSLPPAQQISVVRPGIGKRACADCMGDVAMHRASAAIEGFAWSMRLLLAGRQDGSRPYILCSASTAHKHQCHFSLQSALPCRKERELQHYLYPENMILPTVRPPGQFVNKPGVNGAHSTRLLLHSLLHLRHIFHEPDKFVGRKVCANR